VREVVAELLPTVKTAESRVRGRFTCYQVVYIIVGWAGSQRHSDQAQ
jgi:hypothetical protein